MFNGTLGIFTNQTEIYRYALFSNTTKPNEVTYRAPIVGTGSAL